MGEVVTLTQPPTTQERYQHLRENAEAFVANMATMVAALEREGKTQQASDLKVWALMPWQAAIRDDDSGDLWFCCEACGMPIKDDSERVPGDACDFHRACLPRS